MKYLSFGLVDFTLRTYLGKEIKKINRWHKTPACTGNQRKLSSLYCLIISWNHRMVWIGRDCNDDLFPVPCVGRDNPHWIRLHLPFWFQRCWSAWISPALRRTRYSVPTSRTCSTLAGKQRAHDDEPQLPGREEVAVGLVRRQEPCSGQGSQVMFNDQEKFSALGLMTHRAHGTSYQLLRHSYPGGSVSATESRSSTASVAANPNTNDAQPCSVLTLL